MSKNEQMSIDLGIQKKIELRYLFMLLMILRSQRKFLLKNYLMLFIIIVELIIFSRCY